MPLIEPRFRTLFLTLFAVFILYGGSMTIIGATLPKILADFHWDYLAAGIVLGAGTVAYFVGTFAAGYLAERWDLKPTILLGLALACAGLVFFATTPNPWINAFLGVLIGLGQGGIELGINSLTLRLDPRHTGRPMNLMHGAFAIGAILGSIAVGALIKMGLNWFLVYRIMAVVFALLAGVFLFMHVPAQTRQPAASTTTPTERLSAHPAYWLSCLALFFYVGVELGVSNWIAEYFSGVFKVSAATSPLLVGVFWAGLLAGRFGVPLFYRGTRQDVLLIGLSASATVALILLTILGYVAPSPLTTAIGIGLVFIAGLGCSVYYPVVITLLGKCFPHAQNRVVGFAAAGGGLGAFVFPFLMSALAQNWGLRIGFATYAVFAVAMTASAVGLSVAATKGYRQRS